jgi:hypothetical protein
MRKRKRKRKNVLVLLAQYLGENAEERGENAVGEEGAEELVKNEVVAGERAENVVEIGRLQ